MHYAPTLWAGHNEACPVVLHINYHVSPPLINYNQEACSTTYITRKVLSRAQHRQGPTISCNITIRQTRGEMLQRTTWPSPNHNIVLTGVTWINKHNHNPTITLTVP